jgi:hypothetical protein
MNDKRAEPEPKDRVCFADPTTGRMHYESADCWCKPTVGYVRGFAIWVHNDGKTEATK